MVITSPAWRKTLFSGSFLLLFFLVIPTFCWSQGSEIGIGIGGFNYSGDLSRGLNVNSTRPGITGFYRYNISEPLSFRASLTGGLIMGWDEKTPIDAFADKRDASFDITIFEVSGVFEYHFLKWREENFPIRWTPYVFGGIALFGITQPDEKPEEYSNVQPSIPFGVGIKYILNPKLYLGLEFGARKTFFDYLDNVSRSDGLTKDYQYGNEYDTDVYYYTGVSITYSFYTIPCPQSPYSKKNFPRR